MSENFFRLTDSELLTGSANFSRLINQDPEAFGVSVEQAEFYATVNARYDEAYRAAANDATRTRGAVAGKNDARKALVAAARNLANVIKTNPDVTSEQLISLGLKERSSPTKIPAPERKPTIRVVSVWGNTIDIKLTDAIQPRRGRPEGTIGADVFVCVGEKPGKRLSEWPFQSKTTSTRHTISLPNSIEPGAKVWIVARWLNRRLQTGPVADAVATRVQGPLVGLAA